jgi:hypothetical protein
MLNDLYQKAEQITQSKEYQEALSTTANLANQQSWSAQDEKGKRLSDGIAKSWDEAKVAQYQAVKSFNEAERYEKQAQYVKSSSATIHQEHAHLVLDWLANQQQDNTGGHIGHREAARILTQEPGLSTRYIERYLSEKALTVSMPEEVASRDSLYSAYEQESRHRIVDVDRMRSQEDMADIRRTAFEQGLVGPQENQIQSELGIANDRAQAEFENTKTEAVQTYNEKARAHYEKSQKHLLGVASKKFNDHITSLSPVTEEMPKEQEVNIFNTLKDKE